MFAEKMTGGFDVVLDLNGGPYFAASLEAMAMKGRIILIGGVAGGKTNVDLYQILRKRLHVIGTVMRAGTMQRLGSEAGFSAVERLDEPELETLRFYRMAP